MKNKNFYNKTYLDLIFIAKECISREDENCEPHQLVDLTENNHLNLNNTPIPLCLFNLTNNNVITSMECPESLSDSKKQYDS